MKNNILKLLYFFAVAPFFSMLYGCESSSVDIKEAWISSANKYSEYFPGEIIFFEDNKIFLYSLLGLKDTLRNYLLTENNTFITQEGDTAEVFKLDNKFIEIKYNYKYDISKLYDNKFLTLHSFTSKISVCELREKLFDSSWELFINRDKFRTYTFFEIRDMLYPQQEVSYCLVYYKDDKYAHNKKWLVREFDNRIFLIIIKRSFVESSKVFLIKSVKKNKIEAIYYYDNDFIEVEFKKID